MALRVVIGVLSVWTHNTSSTDATCPSLPREPMESPWEPYNSRYCSQEQISMHAMSIGEMEILDRPPSDVLCTVAYRQAVVAVHDVIVFEQQVGSTS